MPKQPDEQKLKDDADAISAKIADRYEKLGAKFREKANKASSKLASTTNDEKRAIHRRRFELYGDAATDLEERARQMGTGQDGADE